MIKITHLQVKVILKLRLLIIHIFAKTVFATADLYVSTILTAVPAESAENIFIR